MNNLFSKTIKTFLTSVFISLFVFGSFYFLLSSEPKTEEIKVAEKKTTPKLVINDNPSSQDKDVLGTTSNSGNLIAQLADDYAVPTPATTTPTNQIIAPIPPVTATAPSIIMPVTTTQEINTPTLPAMAGATTTTTSTTRTATGVPATGNESLYLMIAAFSIISGFLIVNGKSLAYRSFEKM